MIRYLKDTKNDVNSCLIALLLALFTIACSAIKQSDIGIQDKQISESIIEASKLYDKEKYEDALDILSEANRKASIREDKLKIAEILFKGGFALQEKKLFKTALSYYEHSLEINRNLDNKSGLVKDYSYIAQIYTDLGRYGEGIQNFEAALEIQEELNDKAGIAHNLNNVANLYSYLGDYKESISLLDQALSTSEEIGDLSQIARTLINLGTINFRLRNYKQSIAFLDRAFQIADQAKEENQKAYVLNLKGVVYRQQGEYEKALENYQTALKINKRLDLKSEVATNLSIIGELYKELGRYDEAQKYLQQSLDMSTTSKDKLMTAVNLNYIGEVKYKLGKYEEALGLYNSSLGIFEDLDFKDRIARSYNNIGYLKGETKQWDIAIQNFDKAISLYRELGDREWIRVALFGKGVYLEDKGDLTGAENNYKEAVDVFESIRKDVVGGEEAEQIFSDVNAQIYEKLVSLLIRLGRKEEALEYIERSRSKTLRDTFLKSGINSFDDKTRGLLESFDEIYRRENSINYELVKERSKPSPDLKKIENLVETLAETRNQFRQVTSQLSNDYPDLYSFLSIKPETILDLKWEEKIPRDVIFVEYFITDDETYMFLISEKDLVVKRVSITKMELNKLVALFRDLIKRNKAISPNGWRDDRSKKYKNNIKPLKDISLRLYSYLIQPLEEEIRNVETVAIIPFGSLHYLPFHALAREDKDGDLEFFIEKKRLVYLVSTSTNYLNVILGNNQKKEIERIVAFGNPDLGESELSLPHSEQEVLAIKGMFPNAITFLNKDATKANFNNSWGGHEIIHLAAHGLIQEEPSILLAPLGVGNLTLSDIMGLQPLRNTHLIVLSVCDAAVNRNKNNPTGAELNSLAMAFTWVGIPSVIATLWKVHDRATSDLMTSFYENLNNQGKFEYEALRKAQIEMLNRSDKYGQPFYWAPFILIGVWG